MNIFKNKTYISFIFYFVFYGIVISLFTSFVNYKIQYSDIEKGIKQNAEYTSMQKINRIESYIEGIKQNLYSITNNPTFIRYLENSNPENKEQTQNIFINTAMSNINFFQVRFINKDGLEIIRVDKDRATNYSFVVSEKNLQDKSNRYYFQESIKSSQGMYWRSKIDLNVERGVIEKPIRPTIRVSTPVYHNQILHGIVIINVDLTKLFNAIQQSSDFIIYIADNEGNFLIHPNEKNSWSKYLKNGYKLSDEFPNKYKIMLSTSSYKSMLVNSFSLERAIQNNEDLSLILKTENDYVTNLKNNNYLLTLYLTVLILVVSIPLGVFISLTPARLQEKLNILLKENAEQLDIIDKHVITSTTDLNGNIIDLSTAMCKISGYSKEELIGKNMSVLKSGNLPKELYETLWRTIKNGLVWQGEIENKTKNGDYYWLEITILPRLNSNNVIENYMAICTDITDKKIIEYISEHDKLTKLYNRTKLDKVLEHEYLRSQRYKNTFSIIIIDLDHFKSVNDTYGHLVGDSVLVELADILQSSIRSTDTLGRWGGEEFLIICPQTDLSGAKELAEEIRRKVDNHTFKTIGNKTISIGVSELNNDDNIESLLKRSDDCLYEAKESGRNCVKS
ncbi:GGDEF domain-containing protein [Sulfurimonas sp.]|uniref:sensor domain-containing diguanylate cyclase n=1 Tax=Sulfurimonas sp. TaxID=2022749 RepID=UPI003569FC4F